VGIALLLSSALSPLDAQNAGMLVLESPAGTEAMAYGNAPYLWSSSPSLVFYAPALLERTAGAVVGFQRYASEGTLASAAASGDVLGGGFAIGAQYMRYGLDGGFPQDRDMQSVALTRGEIGVTEFVGSIGYARTLFGIRAGAALKYVEQSANRTRESSASVDLGLAKDVGPIMISLAGRNLGGDLKLSPGPTDPQPIEVQLPRQFIAGLSSQDFEVGPFDMAATTQVTRRRDGQYIPAGGVEVAYWPVAGYTFHLRGGLQRVSGDARSPFTLGGAFTGDAITIEYAYQAFDERGNAHRIGLRWNQ
jgi:hypothetical protein